MNPTLLSILTGLITSGVISSIVVALFERRKRKAEADSIVAEAARALVQPLTERIDDLEAERLKMSAKIGDLEAGRRTDLKKIIDLQGRVDELQAQSEAKDRKIAELQAGVIDRDGQISLLRREVEDLRAQLEGLGQKPKRKTGELHA